MPVALTVNLEVFVQGEHNPVFVEFRHPHKAGIGKGHRDILVPVHQFPESSSFRGQRERDLEIAAGYRAKQAALGINTIPQKVNGLNKDGFAGRQIPIMRL